MKLRNHFFLLSALVFCYLLFADVAVARLCEPPFCDPAAERSFGQRFALVIGNSNYLGDAHLDNPQNDAADFSLKLEEMGFQVETLVNGDYASMKSAIERFGAKLMQEPKAVGLFFFAGHGMQQSDQNFLIPVDMVEAIRTHGQVEGYAVSLNDVVDSMNRGAVSIIILDACRDNPFAGAMSGTGRTLSRVGSSTTVSNTSSSSISRIPRMGGSGLAQPPKASNRALFAYATSPGDVAQDGTGQRNSPFTSGLLISMKKEHRLEEVFAETSESVFKKTGNKQKPWLTHSLGDVKFYF